MAALLAATGGVQKDYNQRKRRKQTEKHKESKVGHVKDKKVLDTTAIHVENFAERPEIMRCMKK